MKPPASANLHVACQSAVAVHTFEMLLLAHEAVEVQILLLLLGSLASPRLRRLLRHGAHRDAVALRPLPPLHPSPQPPLADRYGSSLHVRQHVCQQLACTTTYTTSTPAACVRQQSECTTTCLSCMTAACVHVRQQPVCTTKLMHATHPCLRQRPLLQPAQFPASIHDEAVRAFMVRQSKPPCTAATPLRTLLHSLAAFPPSADYFQTPPHRLSTISWSSRIQTPIIPPFVDTLCLYIGTKEKQIERCAVLENIVEQMEITAIFSSWLPPRFYARVSVVRC